jgi:hypothetical protein
MMPLAQITCTLSITTTDALPGINSFATAAILADYTGLALVTGNIGDNVTPHEDYFRLDNATPGWTYRVTASPRTFGNYNLGMIAYDSSLTPILTDTNPFDGNTAYIILVAPDVGPYYFKVFQYSDQCSGGTYELDATALQPTPTPGPPATQTPTNTPPPEPTATRIPGADRFEPNYDFDHAATIATDVTYSNLNFVPWHSWTEDNDFYKIWVKPNLMFTCETLDLDPGLDPNIIIYNNNREPIAGNDDITLGDYRSRISFFSTYEGFLYVLVGHGGRFPFPDVENSQYSLRCAMDVPGQQATATPDPPAPTSTRRPPATQSSPLPTATRSSDELTVRLLATPAPPPPPSEPSTHFVPVDLIVYYDFNEDHRPGAGEGIAGIMVLAYDTATGRQIAQGFTDELGHLEFTAAAEGMVRLSIPYLGVSHMIGEEGATLYARVAPSPSN